MPGGQRSSMFGENKKNHSLKNVPVYMYSASNVTQTIINLALERGASAWIKKPIELKEYQRIFTEALHVKYE